MFNIHYVLPPWTTISERWFKLRNHDGKKCRQDALFLPSFVFVYVYITYVGNFYVFLGWGVTVHLVRRPLTGILYQHWMIGDECGAVDGMKIGRGNQNARRKPAPAPLCPPQIPHYLTWARTRAAAVGSRRLAAWAMARSLIFMLLPNFKLKDDYVFIFLHF
jgi:hypothetical protein